MAIRGQSTTPRKVNGVSQTPINPSTASVSNPSSLHTSPETALRTLASTLVQRFQFASQHGFASFEGLRNLFVALGFPATLQFRDYMSRYERGGIAKTLVDLHPTEMWGKGVSITETEDPKQVTQFDKDVKVLLTKYLDQFEKADILACIGQYSVVLIGVREAISDLSQPLPKSIGGPSNVIYLEPYSEEQAKIHSLNNDPNSERWGKPERYTINTGTVNDSGVALPGKSLPVHWSRVIHLAHDTLQCSYSGKPVLQSSWNDQESLYKIIWGGAEAAWRNMDTRKHIKLDPEFKFTQEQIDDLFNQLDEQRHNLRNDLETKGVDIEQLSSVVNNFGPNADTCLDVMAGTHRIPKHILLGAALGVQASAGQDRKTLDNTIALRAAKKGSPLLRQFVDRMVEHGGVTKPSNSEGIYIVKWGDEQELDELGKATLAKTLKESDTMSVDEIRDRVWGLEPMNIDDTEDGDKDKGGDDSVDGADENDDNNGTKDGTGTDADAGTTTSAST